MYMYFSELIMADIQYAFNDSGYITLFYSMAFIIVGVISLMMALEKLVAIGVIFNALLLTSPVLQFWWMCQEKGKIVL